MAILYRNIEGDIISESDFYNEMLPYLNGFASEGVFGVTDNKGSRWFPINENPHYPTHMAKQGILIRINI